MKYFIKSIALAVSSIFIVACSSDKDFDASADVNNTDEGISLSLEVTAGSSSRILYQPVDISETVTKYRWALGDHIYVIDDKGRQLGKLELTGGAQQMTATFEGDKIKVHDGQRVHLWYFGQTQKISPRAYEWQLSNTLTDADIDHGFVNVTNEQQLFEPLQTDGTYDNLFAQPYDILARTGIIKITSDGKGQVWDAVNEDQYVTMKHLCSLLTVAFKENGSYKDIGRTLRVDGCRSRATINLVDECIASSEVAPIYLYNNSEARPNVNVMIFPGESSPTFTLYDKKDQAYVGTLGTADVESGIHYIDWNNKDFSAGVPNRPVYPINVDVLFSREENYFVPGEFQVSDDPSKPKVEFGKGNLYAYGTKFPATVGQAYEQWIFNPENITREDGSVDFYWGFLDGVEKPKNVFDRYDEKDWYHYTEIGANPADSKYDIGKRFATDATVGASRNYRLLSSEEWTYLFDKYLWAYVQLLDDNGNLITDGYTGKPAQGLFLTNVKADELHIGGAQKFLELGCLLWKQKLQEFLADIITEETFWKETGLQTGFGKTTTKLVQIPVHALSNKYSQGTLFLPIRDQAAFTPYWTSTPAGSGNVKTLNISEVAYYYTGEKGLHVELGQMGATYPGGLMRLVADVE